MSYTPADVTIVLSTFTEKRWNDLRRAVQALSTQPHPPGQILVVVDHNRPLLERARAELEGVTSLENRHARGLSGARNSGIDAAHGEIIAFLDDDAEPAADWLEQLLKGYDEPNVLGVGGAIIPVWDVGRPRWFPEEFDWVVGCTYRGLPETPAPTRNLIGCNMSFHRSVFEGVGGFRSGIGRVGGRPVGCEETELCIRAAQRLGAELLYVPQARVWHRVAADRGQWRYFVRRCYSEGLSKAQVARYVGHRDGLESERVYTRRTLPRGIGRSLLRGVRQLDAQEWLPAAAILLGLGATALGFGLGTLAQRGDGGAQVRRLTPRQE